jgi:hypothetical protein
VTLFGYDALGRQTSQTRLGITMQNTLDATRRIAKRNRIGADSTQIRQSSLDYNSANFLITETNALNGVTYYSQTNNGPGNWSGRRRTSVRIDAKVEMKRQCD